jgi:hypothetical protein
MAENSNVDELMGRLDAWVEGFNFLRPGKDQSLGRDVVMTIIRGPDAGALGGIAGRIADGVQPDGTPMKPNAPAYAEDKEKRYGWSEVARRTGQSASQVSLYGRTRIDEKSIEMVYGTDEPPDKSVSPNGHISKADRAISDTRKGMFLTQQGRAFYDFDDSDRENVIKVAGESLKDHIESWNNDTT